MRLASFCGRSHGGVFAVASGDGSCLGPSRFGGRRGRCRGAPDAGGQRFCLAAGPGRGARLRRRRPRGSEGSAPDGAGREPSVAPRQGADSGAVSEASKATAGLLRLSAHPRLDAALPHRHCDHDALLRQIRRPVRVRKERLGLGRASAAEQC